MSTQENAEIVKDFFAAVGRGDKQGLLALWAIKWMEDSGFRDDSRKYDARSFTRLAELSGWDVTELWTDSDRLFAVFRTSRGRARAGQVTDGSNRRRS